MSSKWETVISCTLSRTPVPGGWIYKSRRDGMCFVPTPLNMVTGVASKLCGDGIVVDADFSEVDQNKEKAS